ncbi:MAG: FecR family protein [Candidatus Dormibacteraeota bacterium]|nr:FecR family protein [Candidatus Dormibacteraeota bacterium]
MSAVAARTAPRRRGGRRLLLALVILILIAGGGIFWVNQSAQAAVSVSASLTVYQPIASLQRGGGAYAGALTGAQVHAGESVKTDTNGRASIQLPDGTLTRLASDTEIKLDSAHVAKSGTLHDARITEKVGRTFTSVQRLVAGATFQVAGQSAVASVRGTKFEVYNKPDGTMIVKLFDGELDFDGQNHRHLIAPQQATADPNGNIGQPGPIQPDPDDPFGPALAAQAMVSAGTTPGTEQDFIGAPLHNGEQQEYRYSYAGGGLIKASLGYPGSAMKLKVQGPDGQIYTGTGTSPITLVVNNAPAGIYHLFVIGVSGLGTVGEEPFLAVASVEQCVSTDIDQNNAVRHGYTAQDLVAAVQVSGLSNLKLTVAVNSPAGAIVTGTGTYNGVGWTGSVLLVAHSGVLEITAVGGSVFGVSVPAQQVVQQIGSAIGQDPSSLNPGFTVDRLFACNSVVMIDGHHAG